MIFTFFFSMNVLHALRKIEKLGLMIVERVVHREPFA